MKTEARPHVIWLFTDGKSGHENQSKGLLLALSEKISTVVIKLQPISFWQILHGLFTKKNAELDELPRPALVVGSGHATHLSLLLVSWLYGARSIVLMKPSLPLSLFDLCLVPEHDEVKPRGNVIQTMGVLNRVRLSVPKKDQQGVILVGGPSSHYGWDDGSLLDQLKSIVETTPEINWLVSDSRRTPEDTSMGIANLDYDNLVFQSCQTVSAEWLPTVLAESRYAWVTEESVSMVYEALTAQAAVGLLYVPKIKKSRVSKGITALIEAGYVMPFRQWKKRPGLEVKVQMQNEADRCAGEIVNKFHLD